MWKWVGRSSLGNGRASLWAHLGEQVALGVPGKSCLAAGGFQWLLLAEQRAVKKFGLLAMSSSPCKCSDCIRLCSASVPHLPPPVPTPCGFPYIFKKPLYDNKSYLKQKWFCFTLHTLQNTNLSAAQIKCL